jgi:hypothetical protein
MEVVENTLDVDLDSFLDRRLFCFIAQGSPEGPRVSPLWYLWEADTLWCIATRTRSYVDRIDDNPQTAVAIVDFDPEAGLVQHVGMRGLSRIEPFDPALGDQLLGRYLGENENGWPDRFRDLSVEDHAILRFNPSTVVARDQSYPR